MWPSRWDVLPLSTCTRLSSSYPCTIKGLQHLCWYFTRREEKGHDLPVFTYKKMSRETSCFRVLLVVFSWLHKSVCSLTRSSVPLCKFAFMWVRVSSIPLVGWLLTEQEAGPVGRIYFKNLLYNFGSFRLQCLLSAYGCSPGDALSELHGCHCFSFALLCFKLTCGFRALCWSTRSSSLGADSHVVTITTSPQPPSNLFDFI